MSMKPEDFNERFKEEYTRFAEEFLRLSIKYSPPEAFVLMFTQVVDLAFLVKKEQPEFWKHFEKLYLSNLFYALTSKDTLGSIKLILEELEAEIEKNK